MFATQAEQIAEMQTEVRGLQVENRRILDHPKRAEQTKQGVASCNLRAQDMTIVEVTALMQSLISIPTLL